MPGQQQTMTGHAVAAVFVKDGSVLAGRRNNPERLRGLWEFFGGNAIGAEALEHALVRTCRDELGVEIEVGELIGSVPVTDRFDLNLFVARIIDGDPAPIKDHDEMRWVALDALDDLPWAPLDAEFHSVIRNLVAG